MMMMAGIAAMTDFICNAEQLAERWAKRRAKVPAAMQKATKDSTFTLFTESRKQMNTLIYDKPVPTRAQIQAERMGVQQGKGRLTGIVGKGGRYGTQKGGAIGYKGYTKAGGSKPAWKRTATLKRSERWEIISGLMGLVINDAKTKKSGKGYAAARHYKTNTRFPAPWRDVAITKVIARIRQIYRTAMFDAMK